MELVVNTDAAAPLYRQIAAQIHYLIASGLLESDAALPSIRSLSIKLRVAPNTIAQAYEELEAGGVVCKRRGLGTFVSSRDSHGTDQEHHQIIERRIDALFAEAHKLNVTVEAVVQLVRMRQAVALADRIRELPLATPPANLPHSPS